MRRLIAAALIAGSALVCPLALAAPDVAGLSVQFARRLEQHPVFRAEFMQEKQMAAFKKPLVTRGRIVYVHNTGVIWKLESPLKATYVLTDKRVAEIGEDGKMVVREAREVPGIEQVGRVFRALLGGQTEAVSDLFAVSSSGTAAAWQMTLSPKPGPLQQHMAQIEMRGGRHLENLAITEARGDKTLIGFRNFVEADAPSANERTWLGLQQ